MWGKAVEGGRFTGTPARGGGARPEVARPAEWGTAGRQGRDLRSRGQWGVKAETCGVEGRGHLCGVGRCDVRTVSRAGVAPSPRRPWSRRGGEVFRPLSGAGHLGVFQNVPPRRGVGGQVCSVRGMHRISFRSPLSSGVGSVGAKAAWPGGSPWSVAFPDDCGIITPRGRLWAAGRMSTG